MTYFAKTVIASQEDFIFKQANGNNTCLPLIYIKKTWRGYFTIFYAIKVGIQFWYKQI